MLIVFVFCALHATHPWNAKLSFSSFFPELSFWLTSIEHNDYAAPARHSFSYPARCEKSLVTPSVEDERSCKIRKGEDRRMC